jgi:hypothetical protein
MNRRAALEIRWARPGSRVIVAAPRLGLFLGGPATDRIGPY